jgi:3-hydroxyisobutyrate dehydrogenase-like beta-hydroxyacid dehydrogenase
MMKELDRRAGEKAIGILDAPIARGRFAADDGTLLAFAGGTPAVVARAQPIYRAFCS